MLPELETEIDQTSVVTSYRFDKLLKDAAVQLGTPHSGELGLISLRIKVLSSQFGKLLHLTTKGDSLVLGRILEENNHELNDLISQLFVTAHFINIEERIEAATKERVRKDTLPAEIHSLYRGLTKQGTERLTPKQLTGFVKNILREYSS